MRLVYLSPVPWHSFAQRPHKFVEWFWSRTGAEVLWVDPYATRFPSLADFRRSETRTAGQAIVPPWLTLVRPRSVPVEPLPGSQWINGALWRGVVDEVERFAAKHSIFIGIGKPSVLALKVLERVGSDSSLYDAMDDFPAFYSGISRLAMASREQTLARRVTRIVTSSTALKQRWDAVQQDVRLVHNGFDVRLMPGPRRGVRQKRKRIFGYVGTIGRWFDWDWLCALARARPNDTIRLIGPVYTPPPQRLPKNVELLPPREHTAALQAMLEFDLGFIPFKKNKLTNSVDPIKYYEYRALGLAVLSTSFGEMSLRLNELATFLSLEVSDVGDSVASALEYVPDLEEVLEFRTQNSWEARFAASDILF